MNIILEELTISEIDEALAHLRLKLEDKYGNRLTHAQKAFYIEQVDCLLDARLELKANENQNSSDF